MIAPALLLAVPHALSPASLILGVSSGILVLSALARASDVQIVHEIPRLGQARSNEHQATQRLFREALPGWHLGLWKRLSSNRQSVLQRAAPAAKGCTVRLKKAATASIGTAAEEARLWRPLCSCGGLQLASATCRMYAQSVNFHRHSLCISVPILQRPRQ